MCTYCGTNKYRKIYENHIGPIPREDNGRTYEIHHIDGDHSNNASINLTAVTLQEHYDIHYAQGDFGACLLMAKQRMNKAPEELSALGTKNNKAKVKDGTHPWLKRPDGSSLQQERANNPNYVNPFSRRTDGTSIQTDRVINQTHHLQGGEIQRKTNKKLLEEGVHKFQNEIVIQKMKIRRKERLQNGTHVFSPANNPCYKQLTDGTHPSKMKLCCMCCRKDVDVANFSQYHGEKCRSLNPLNNLLGKVSCTVCKKTTDRGNFSQHHGNKCKNVKS
jgi:hypothetical protein